MWLLPPNESVWWHLEEIAGGYTGSTLNDHQHHAVDVDWTNNNILVTTHHQQCQVATCPHTCTVHVWVIGIHVEVQDYIHTCMKYMHIAELHLATDFY